jgi:hypothetical protein
MVVLSQLASVSGVRVIAPRMVARSKVHGTHTLAQGVRVSIVRVDAMHRTAGRSRKMIARALGIAPSGVSRRTSGESPTSSLGAAKADAYALEASNLDASFMVVEIKAAQEQARLRGLTLAELRGMLAVERMEETAAQALADPVQMRAATLGTTDSAQRQQERDLCAKHAARLERIVALLDEIEYRESRGGK